MTGSPLCHSCWRDVSSAVRPVSLRITSQKLLVCYPGFCPCSIAKNPWARTWSTRQCTCPIMAPGYPRTRKVNVSRFWSPKVNKRQDNHQSLSCPSIPNMIRTHRGVTEERPGRHFFFFRFMNRCTLLLGALLLHMSLMQRTSTWKLTASAAWRCVINRTLLR